MGTETPIMFALTIIHKNEGCMRKTVYHTNEARKRCGAKTEKVAIPSSVPVQLRNGWGFSAVTPTLYNLYNAIAEPPPTISKSSGDSCALRSGSNVVTYECCWVTNGKSEPIMTRFAPNFSMPSCCVRCASACGFCSSEHGTTPMPWRTAGHIRRVVAN